jgi:hypothetical protein
MEYYSEQEIKQKIVDISNLNFNNLKRISSQNDIDNIKCEFKDHRSPLYNISPTQKIVALGDIHGDLTSLLVILFGAELINTNLEWIGGNTFLVFTGDLLDNYRDSESIDFMKQHPADEITIISYLADLNTQALKTEGRVLLTLGNHELMNIIDNDFRYVSKQTKQFFKDYISSRNEQFKPNSILRQKISCLFEPLIIINKKYLFCHAGPTPEFIVDLNLHYAHKKNMDEKLIEFTRDIKNVISGATQNDPRNKWIIDHIKSVRNKKHFNGSFFWTRYYGKKNLGCDVYDTSVSLLGLGNLILIKGHDVQNKTNESCNKKIYLADTRMSRSFLDKSDQNSQKLISDYMYFIEIQNNVFSMFSVRLSLTEEVYKEKLEQFIYNETNPLPKSLINKIKDKTGMAVIGIRNALSNIVKREPSSFQYEVSHDDGTTYYDENDAPHDEMGRVLFGGFH